MITFNQRPIMRKNILAVFTLLVAMVSVAAAADVDERQKEIRAVLEHSGLAEVIEQVPLFIQAGMNDSLKEQRPEMSRGELVVISDILKQSFASDAILRDTVAHMDVHYDPQRIARVLKQ